MRVDKELLISRGARCQKVETFAVEWPDGCEVTPDVCRRALDLGLSLSWAAANLLSRPAYVKYLNSTKMIYGTASLAQLWYDTAVVLTGDDYLNAIARAFYDASRIEGNDD